MIFTGLTVTFLQQFGLGFWLTLHLLFSLAAVITLLGQIVGAKEGWAHFESFYWSFITATIVGSGDIRRLPRVSRALSIAIAFLGLTLTGIIAVAVHAATLALGKIGHESEEPRIKWLVSHLAE